MQYVHAPQRSAKAAASPKLHHQLSSRDIASTLWSDASLVFIHQSLGWLAQVPVPMAEGSGRADPQSLARTAWAFSGLV